MIINRIFSSENEICNVFKSMAKKNFMMNCLYTKFWFPEDWVELEGNMISMWTNMVVYKRIEKTKPENKERKCNIKRQDMGLDQK